MKEHMDTTNLGYDQPYAPNAYVATDMYASNPYAYPGQTPHPQHLPYPGPVNYPQPYPSNNIHPNHLHQQAFTPFQPVVVVPAGYVNIGGVKLSHKEHKTVDAARRARITALVNMIIDLLVLLYIPFLLILIIVNILGIFSTTRFNKCLAVTYIVYLYLLVILKAILIAMLPLPLIIGIFSVLIIINITVSGFFISFVKRMGDLSHSELDTCRLYHLTRKKKCC
jgi:hypothetical protein